MEGIDFSDNNLQMMVFEARLEVTMFKQRVFAISALWGATLTNHTSAIVREHVLEPPFESQGPFQLSRAEFQL